MVKAGSLAVYKNRPALVSGAGEKISLAFSNGETLRVREKDITVLHPGPLRSLAGIGAVGGGAESPASLSDGLRGAWELLEGSELSLRELAELVFGGFTPQSAWETWLLLADGLYFTGTPDSIRPRSAEELKAAEEKRLGKAREAGEREAFLLRLKKGELESGDGRFMQDVEALAYGGTEKSRTMREINRSETPQEAHRLLLETGLWDVWINPHPRRFGIIPGPAAAPFPPLPEEERKDLTGFPAFAIDNAWSADPDDALSLETSGGADRGRRILYVHVADPAAAVFPDGGADREARGRGATLYLPEGIFPMLHEAAVEGCALGLRETSPALSVKITLEQDGSINHEETEIFPSIVKVTRLSYGAADALAAGVSGEGPAGASAESGRSAVLAALFRLGEANLRRRLGAGAVNIELPEVHISAGPPDTGLREIRIDPLQSHKSAETVRECMLLAGEAAAAWAFRRKLPFPYITQEAGDLPRKPLEGIAGAYQLRRCMRPRSISVRPGYHWGLGLEGYTQVTSSLRRYTDLLAHQQIRAFLRREAGGGGHPLNEEETLLRLAAGDAASQAVTQAERASRMYWTAVYLEGLLKGRRNRDAAPEGAAGTPGAEGLIWEGVVLEKRGNYTALIIPDLALEIQAGIRKNAEPNERLKLRLSKVRIPEAEAVFEQVL